MTSAGGRVRPSLVAARAVRVAFWAPASVALVVGGLWLVLNGREVAGRVPSARPEFLELGARSAGVALVAAAQVAAGLGVVRAVHRPRPADAVFGLAAAAVLLVAAVGAVICWLTGR